MNIFKKISLANRVLSTIKSVRELAESNASKAKEVKKVLDNLKADFDALLALLPFLRDLYNEIKELLKNVK